MQVYTKTNQQHPLSKVKWHNGANTHKNVLVSLLYKKTLNVNAVKVEYCTNENFSTEIVSHAIQVQCTLQRF